MGRDKALLPLGRGTLAQSVAEAVRQAAGSVSLVGGPSACLGYRILPDLYPGAGPLGGILTALQDSTADWNLVVACDMPAITADFLTALLRAACDCGADALVPTGDGRLEPLCAVYHRRCHGPLSVAFTGGVRKVATALEQVRAVLWPVSEVSYFQNVNTPEDWAAHDR